MEGDGGSLKKLETNPRFHKAFMQFGVDCGLKPQVSRAEAVGTVHLPGVRTESRDFGGRRLSQTAAQDGGGGGNTHFHV